MKRLKLLVPDLNALKSNETKNTQDKVSLALCAIMVVVVFLPWVRFTTLDASGKVNELISSSALGITTWYGIIGLVVALLAGYGIYRKQYALTFWGCVAGAIFGYVGMNSFTDITIEDGIVFKETFEACVREGNATAVNHIGAKIFTMAALLLAGLSLTKVFCKCEEKEESPISKVVLGLAIAVGAIICIDAIIIEPSIFSSLASKAYAWGIPTATVILLVYAFLTNCKEGKSNKLNTYAVIILAVAFLFTNNILTTRKFTVESSTDIKNIERFVELDKSSYDDRDDKKSESEKTKAAAKDKLDVKQPTDNAVKKGKDSNSQDGGNHDFEDFDE